MAGSVDVELDGARRFPEVVAVEVGTSPRPSRRTRRSSLKGAVHMTYSASPDRTAAIVRAASDRWRTRNAANQQIPPRHTPIKPPQRKLVREFRSAPDGTTLPCDVSNATGSSFQYSAVTSAPEISSWVAGGIGLTVSSLRCTQVAGSGSWLGIKWYRAPLLQPSPRVSVIWPGTCLRQSSTTGNVEVPTGDEAHPVTFFH
jgi:hypothetical protein